MDKINIGEWCNIKNSGLDEDKRIEHCDNTLICYDCEYNTYHEDEE